MLTFWPWLSVSECSCLIELHLLQTPLCMKFFKKVMTHFLSEHYVASFSFWPQLRSTSHKKLATFMLVVLGFLKLVVSVWRTYRRVQCVLRASKAVIIIAIRLRYDYDTTIPRRIRLRRKWSKLLFAFDSTTTRLRRKLTCSFLLVSNRVEWKQARAIRRSRIVVVW